MDDVNIFRWLLDVQGIWPAPQHVENKPSSTALWASGSEVKKALDLLPVQEQAKALRFYHIRDAKLCLGSNLLKHKAIVDTCNVPWKDMYGSTIVLLVCYSEGGQDRTCGSL